MSKQTPDEFSEILGQIGEGAGTAQTIIALAGAVGAGALWSRLTRSYDQRFLVELTNYKQARDRVAEIRLASREEGRSSASAQKMMKLAGDLEMQADRSLDYAIARANWQNSQHRNWSQGAIALGLTAAFIMFGVYLRSPEDYLLWIILTGLVLMMAGFLGVTIGKSAWLDVEVEDGTHSICRSDNRKIEQSTDDRDSRRGGDA